MSLNIEQIGDKFQSYIIDIFNPDQVNYMYQQILIAKSKCTKLMMGLDSEWVDLNIALLQLSFYNDDSFMTGQVYLIRIYDREKNCHNQIPQQIIDIISDKNIIKIGVDIGHDISHIINDFDFGENDVNHITKLLVDSSFDLQAYHKTSLQEKEKRGN
jgi:hypothetical protein